jgi:hypothetical protein
MIEAIQIHMSQVSIDMTILINKKLVLIRFKEVSLKIMMTSSMQMQIIHNKKVLFSIL